MLDKNLLLVDIGGTNIRYAYSNIGDSGFVSENKAELDSLNDFDNLMSELLAESDVKNIIFSSSAGVYGNNNSSNLIEESELKPINPYAVSKYKIENFLISKIHFHFFVP